MGPACVALRWAHSAGSDNAFGKVMCPVYSRPTMGMTFQYSVKFAARPRRCCPWEDRRDTSDTTDSQPHTPLGPRAWSSSGYLLRTNGSVNWASSLSWMMRSHSDTCHVDGAAAPVSAALGSSSPACAHLVQCVGRRLVLRQEVDKQKLRVPAERRAQVRLQREGQVCLPASGARLRRRLEGWPTMQEIGAHTSSSLPPRWFSSTCSLSVFTSFTWATGDDLCHRSAPSGSSAGQHTAAGCQVRVTSHLSTTPRLPESLAPCSHM